MTDLAPTAVSYGLAEEWIIVVPASGEVVYRVVAGDPLTVRDFKSNRDKGEAQRWVRAGESSLEYLGISVFATEAQARAVVERFPKIGSRIAAVTLSEDMRFARTRRTPGHHTAWGSPEAFLDAAALV